jgi:hypothetical protein
MKIKEFLNAYVSKNGNPTFVHSFEATKEELKTLTESKAVWKTDPDTKENLVWLSEEQPKGTELRLTQNGERLFAVRPLLTKGVQAARNSILAFESLGMTREALVQTAFGGAQ